jgi:membrane associated rhomboid family serine protease
MGLYDRDYTRADFNSRFGSAPQMRMSLPRVTPVVKYLLIINVTVYFMQILGADRALVTWFSVFPVSWEATLQIWRYVTYQFLHGGMWHIVFNMLGLFFLGPTLERHWGSKRFLKFYLGCGIAGGLFYPLLAIVGFLSVGPMIGASGAILGMLAACAILFPHFIVFILFFPVPIRVAAIICIFFATVTILSRGANAGGEAAHLGGMAAGAIYVFSKGRLPRFRPKTRPGRWERQRAAHRNLQVELDRILQKVHDAGIHSLTRKERKVLRQATKAQQKQNTL